MQQQQKLQTLKENRDRDEKERRRMKKTSCNQQQRRIELSNFQTKIEQTVTLEQRHAFPFANLYKREKKRQTNATKTDKKLRKEKKQFLYIFIFFVVVKNYIKTKFTLFPAQCTCFMWQRRHSLLRFFAAFFLHLFNSQVFFSFFFRFDMFTVFLIAVGSFFSFCTFFLLCRLKMTCTHTPDV